MAGIEEGFPRRVRERVAQIRERIVVRPESDHEKRKWGEGLECSAIPALAIRALRRGPEDGVRGSGCLLNNKADCGRRKGPLPDLDFYDRQGEMWASSWHANRLWMGSSW